MALVAIAEILSGSWHKNGNDSLLSLKDKQCDHVAL